MKIKMKAMEDEDYSPNKRGRKPRKPVRLKCLSIDKEEDHYGFMFQVALIPIPGPMPVEGLITFLDKHPLAGFHRTKALLLLGQCDTVPYKDPTHEELHASLARRSIWLREAKTLAGLCMDYYLLNSDQDNIQRVIDMIETAWTDLSNELAAFQSGKPWDPGYVVFDGELSSPRWSSGSNSEEENQIREEYEVKSSSVVEEKMAKDDGAAEEDSGTDADVTDPDDVSEEE